MDKYIIELLKVESTVIIPGLGALMNGAHEGSFVFNKYLKINDHKLEEYISKTDGVDSQEASNSVAKLVREINTKLDQGETYDIFGLGRFYKAEDGSIDFESWEQLKDVADKKEEPKKEEPKKEEVKKEEAKTEVKKETPKKEEVKPAAKSEEVVKPAKVADKSVDPAKEAEKPKNIITPKKEEPKSEAPKAEVPEEKKSEIKSKVDSVSEKKEEVKSAIKPKEDPKAKEIVANEAKLQAAEEKKKKADDIKMAKAKEEEAKRKKIEEQKKAKEAAKLKKLEAKKNKSGAKEGEVKSGGNKVVKIILIILVIIVAGGGTFAVIKWDMVKDLLGMEQTADSDKNEEADKHDSKSDNEQDHIEEQVENVDQAVEDSTMTEEHNAENVEEPIQNDPVVEEKVVKEVPPVKEEPKIQKVTSTGSYHIIVGGFSDNSNADRLVSELQGKGFPAQNLGVYGGLSLVSVKSYGDLQSAKSDLGSFGDYNGAWIFKKK